MNRYIWRKKIFSHITVAFDTKTRNRVILKELRTKKATKREFDNLTQIQPFAAINEHASLLHGTCQKYLEFKTVAIPYTAGNDILEVLLQMKRNEEKLNEKFVRDILHPMGQCIRQLQENDLSHLDIKPENFILSKSHHSRKRLKITLIDFYCLDNYCTRGGMRSISAKCGTRSYLPPEVKYEEKFHKNSDLWSLGLVAAVCSLGFHPFSRHGVTEKNVQDFVKNNLFHREEFSSEIVDSITSLLEYNPNKRQNLF